MNHLVCVDFDSSNTLSGEIGIIEKIYRANPYIEIQRPRNSLEFSKIQLLNVGVIEIPLYITVDSTYAQRRYLELQLKSPRKPTQFLA